METYSMKNTHISNKRGSIFKNGIIQKFYYACFFLLLTVFHVQPATADPPQIGSIADQTTLEDIATSIISFTATDLETAASNLILTMTSSDQTLVPDEYLLYESNSGQYSIVATPAFNQYGTATISVTITDAGGLTACTSFNITVTEVDDSQYMWTNNQAADVVLGQSDFISNSSGTSDSLFSSPKMAAVDPVTGKVFICDHDNNRVLRFSSTNASINGSSAEAVLGQADFISGLDNRGGSVAANTLNGPFHIFVDSFGRLWVVDRSNHRVLRFDNASSKATGSDADGVLGQVDFTSSSSGTTQNTFYLPIGLWVDPAGRLWVGDNGNDRVLRFDNAAMKSNGANADGVLCQPDFVSNTSAVTQSAINSVYDVSGDNKGHLSFLS
ncbi:MAG: NHL repeat protein [Candidatus Magnetoglobus multicellularis str. Araruama]|uniref:NHL repeat protein n=1 Tax=Candidatus Magnetoglobus multicellularis str. Araruama TaxID=890399 RepID=A0A1V1P9C1_9BACT|nr:MAG: NHL repeat protein [Candidatus Magnetoglobus multicellularis str. Araruama]